MLLLLQSEFAGKLAIPHSAFIISYTILSKKEKIMKGGRFGKNITTLNFGIFNMHLD